MAAKPAAARTSPKAKSGKAIRTPSGAIPIPEAIRASKEIRAVALKRVSALRFSG